jgi:hypothetical protein
MARTKDSAAAEELGEALASMWEQYDRPGYREIERTLLAYLGPEISPSNEWIRQAHQGRIDPWTADLVQVDALAKFYGLRVGDLHPVLAARQAFLMQDELPDLGTGVLVKLDRRRRSRALASVHRSAPATSRKAAASPLSAGHPPVVKVAA